MQEENKQLNSEVKAPPESIEFQNEKYKKMKKYMREEKQKLENGYKNNEVVQNLIQQNTNM